MREAPALKVALLFAMGIATAYWLSPPFLWLGLLLTLLWIASLLPTLRHCHNYFISTLLIVTGATSYVASNPPEPNRPLPVTVRGIVSELPLERNEVATFPLKLHYLELPDESIPMRSGAVWVIGELDTLPGLGSLIEVKGMLEPFPAQRNPGQYDLRRYRRSDGMLGRLRVYNPNDLQVIKRDKSLLFTIQSNLNSACDTLGRWDAPLWKGLLLGFRRDLDPELIEEMRVTGLTHLLALSGLNIGFLAVALLGLLSIFPLTPSKRAIPALLIVILYTLLIPDRGASVRASLMVSTALLGVALSRWSSSINSLGLAALLALTYRPGDLFDAGFQMSFAATAGILLYWPQVSKFQQDIVKHGRIARLGTRWLLTPFFISLISSLAVAPFTAYHFFGIPLAGPLYNLIAVPVMGLIYAGAWLAVILFPFHQGVAHLVADGVLVLGFWWRSFVSWAASRAPYWEGFLPPLVIAAFVMLLLWMAISRRSIRARVVIGVAGTSLAMILALLPQTLHSPKLWFLDVGHGDAAVWQLPGNRTIVVDGGPEPLDGSRGVLTNALRRLNIEHVSVMVASHLEADHIGGLPELISRIPVELAILGSGNRTSKAAEELMSTLKNRSIRIVQPSSEELQVEGLTNGVVVSLLKRPANLEAAKVNDRSLPMKLTYRSPDRPAVSFLSCGDIEAAGEHFQATHNDIRAELLKVSHHGSATSSTPEFLAVVSPVDAVITRSSLNERGSAESRRIVLDRYRNANIRLHRVDREGAILFQAGEKRWEKVDWRHPAFWDWLFGRFS